MRLIIVTIVALLGIASASDVSYNGYKVYKIATKSLAQDAFLRTLEPDRDFDFWSSVNKVGNPVSVMIAPKAQSLFEFNLNTIKVNYSVEIDDVESTIQAEKKYHQSKRPLKSGRIAFDQYLRHDEINAYLAQLSKDYPDTVTIETIGQSYQQRNMTVIRISSGSSDPPKPAVFIDAGIHAREWIAPAVAFYLIYQLVENPENSNLIQDVDWIILPSLNPDGYEYTWDENRLWRKTLSKGTKCDGCDGNRNFGYHWMEAGADDNECSEIYAGKEACSEVESQNLRDYLAGAPNVEGYLSLHSFGQYILYPWSYADVLPDNADKLQALGDRMNKAINAVDGTIYVVGSTTATLYAAAGASQDWAMGGAGIDIVFSMELPGGGFFGFDMPPSEIARVAAETFEGLKVFGEYFATKKR